MPEKDRRHVREQDDQRRLTSIFRIAARMSRTLSCRSHLAKVFPFSRPPTNDDSELIVRRTQDPANSQKGWKHREWRTGEARRWSGGRWRRTRAADSGRQKTKSTNKRATEWRGNGGSSYTGGSTEGWRKGTRISYKALLSDWVAEVAIVLCFDSAWWTCLTFNRCVFADNDDDDDAKAKATRQRRQQHRDFIVLPRPYFIVADCSFVSAPLNPAGRFFASKEFFVSGPFSASLTASTESSACRFNQNQMSWQCSEIYDTAISIELN